MFTICYDTIFDGFQPVKDDEEPVTFATEEEATIELESDPEFYEECFVCPLNQIGHKTIFTVQP